MPGITAAHVTAASHPELLQPQHRSRSRDMNHTVKPGCIMWLPERQKIDECWLGNFAVNDGCFNHPVLVLAVCQGTGIATILIITSFKGQDLDEKFPAGHRLREHYLPISPSRRHPEHGILLNLDGNVSLPKKSYIETETRKTIHTSLLVPYSRFGASYSLTRESCKVLAKHIGIIPPPDPFPIPLYASSHQPTSSLLIPHSSRPAESLITSSYGRPLVSHTVPQTSDSRMSARLPTTGGYYSIEANSSLSERYQLRAESEPYSASGPSRPEPYRSGLDMYIVLAGYIMLYGFAFYTLYRFVTYGYSVWMAIIGKCSHVSQLIRLGIASVGMTTHSKYRQLLRGVSTLSELSGTGGTSSFHAKLISSAGIVLSKLGLRGAFSGWFDPT